MYSAHDTRRSTSHPLHHSVINVIRKLADSTSSAKDDPQASTSIPRVQELPSPAPEPASSSLPQTPPLGENGVDYLLTSLTLFTTHEPCIMCSMALVHSRVHRIFFIYPMKETGGCGGCCAVVGLEGVNHRYDVYQWVDDLGMLGSDAQHPALGQDVDA